MERSGVGVSFLSHACAQSRKFSNTYEHGWCWGREGHEIFTKGSKGWEKIWKLNSPNILPSLNPIWEVHAGGSNPPSTCKHPKLHLVLFFTPCMKTLWILNKLIIPTFIQLIYVSNTQNSLAIILSRYVNSSESKQWLWDIPGKVWYCLYDQHFIIPILS